jgi:hypothetical protein
MDEKELRKYAGLEKLDETVDDKEIASEMTKVLGLFRIRSQKIQKDRLHLGDDYLDGWLDAERALNTLIAKEYKGVKPFRRQK